MPVITLAFPIVGHILIGGGVVIKAGFGLVAASLEYYGEEKQNQKNRLKSIQEMRNATNKALDELDKSYERILSEQNKEDHFQTVLAKKEQVERLMALVK